MSVYSIDEAVSFLSRTPVVVRTLLSGLPTEWLSLRERPDGWTALDVVGHFLHGEDTDWIPRVQMILTDGESKPFPTFDQHGHLSAYGGLSIDDLLNHFDKKRSDRLRELVALRLSEADLDKTGIHPAFGRVTLRQHLTTWVVHDLNHLHQLTRILAKRYASDVGPWKAYLSVLK